MNDEKPEVNCRHCRRPITDMERIAAGLYVDVCPTCVREINDRIAAQMFGGR